MRMMLDILGIENLVEGIFAFIPKLIYFIVACVLSLIDVFQLAFRKLAGLDNIIIDGAVTKGDAIYNIIIDSIFNGKYPVFRTAFWALIILGVFMLLIATIIQVIRVEYTEKNSKSEIVKNFFKALISFAIVPIACFFGMYLSNGLINVVDRATASPQVEIEYAEKYFKPWQDTTILGNTSDERVSYASYDIFGLHIPTTSETFSGMVFRTCAYSSNRIRKNEIYEGVSYYEGVFKEISKNSNYEEGYERYFSDVSSPDAAANLIDTAFAISAKTLNELTLNADLLDGYANDYFHYVFGKYTINSFSRYNASLVYYFYDLWTFNYIIAFIALITLSKIFYDLIIFLMCRIYEVAGLFLISPVSISLMPFDNGEALKNWRKAFVKKFVSIIVIVGSFNLVTPLMSIIQEIKFINFPIVDNIIQTFFLIAALMSVQSLNKTISEILGLDDVIKESDGLGSKATNNFNQGLRKATSVAGIGLAAGKTALKLPFKAAGGLVNIANRIGDKKLENKERMADKIQKQEREASSYFNNVKNSKDLAKQFQLQDKKSKKLFNEEYTNYLKNEVFKDDQEGWSDYQNGKTDLNFLKSGQRNKLKQFYAAVDSYNKLDNSVKKQHSFGDFFKTFGDKDGREQRNKLYEESIKAKREKTKRRISNVMKSPGWVVKHSAEGYKYMKNEIGKTSIGRSYKNAKKEVGPLVPNPVSGSLSSIVSGLGINKSSKDLEKEAEALKKKSESKEMADDLKKTKELTQKAYDEQKLANQQLAQANKQMADDMKKLQSEIEKSKKSDK